MKQPKVTIQKFGGDDSLSWAVFVNGVVVTGLTGLNRREAIYYKAQVKAIHELKGKSE